ncbi:hypothetical protein JW777_09085 [bacterium]|nr:hypothetical protein [bacterium]
MNNKNRSALLPIAIFVGLSAFFAGCATTGMERSEKATTTMQTVSEEISKVVVQLDLTGASLNDLTRVGQSDVKSAFDSYSANVLKMDELEKKFTIHADEMKMRGKEYFAEWKKQGNAYANPKIRALSEQRRAELGEVYGKIAEESIGVKVVFKAYMSDIKEIQKFLSNDLTLKGTDSIIPISDKVVQEGVSLKDALNRVQEAINVASVEMAQQ